MSNRIKLYFIEKFSEGDRDQQLEAMRKYFEFTSLEDAEVIYVASINHLNDAIMSKSIRNIPIVTYCWDYYLWAHEGKHSDNNNWRKYADFLQSADLVFVPSFQQQRRLQELLGVNSIVVHTGILTYEAQTEDKRFVLDPVRYYPEEQAHWVEKICTELNIPCVHSEHQFTLEEFRNLVSTCSFMTTVLNEASTGGLTLMEGLWNGKPSIISDSCYQGANDYLGRFAIKVKDDDYEALKEKIKWLWNNPIAYNKNETRKYINDNFSFDLMAKNLYNYIKQIL